MIIPYQVDVPMSRWPVANFAIIGVTSLVFVLMMIQGEDAAGWVGPMILDGWSIGGLLGHVFVHADLLHLIGNMLFLWVFGNAICAKIGNLWYPAVYFTLGMLAAATHNIIDGSPAVGASGAINGVVGMFLILYPLNGISCFWLGGLWWGAVTFCISSYWMILLWFLFDIWGATGEDTGVANWAHIGGFVAGAAIAVGMLLGGLIEMDAREKSLVEIIRGQ